MVVNILILLVAVSKLKSFKLQCLLFSFLLNKILLGELNLTALDLISAMSIGMKSTYIDLLSINKLVDNNTDLVLFYKAQEYGKWNSIIELLSEGEAFEDFFTTDMRIELAVSG